MMILKKLMLALFMTLSLAAMSSAVSAAEEAAVAAEAPKNNASEVVKLLEQALVASDIKQSDFTVATRHLKKAREIAVAMSSHPDGIQNIQDAMKAVKLGLNAEATEYLTKAIEIYKAINN